MRPLPERYRCYAEGHAPPEVEHLPGHRTRIRCPRCNKSVIEHGLSDHPEAWKPASHGAGKRHWGAARYDGREWASDCRGRVIWVESHEAAVKLAARMNAEGVAK